MRLFEERGTSSLWFVSFMEHSFTIPGEDQLATHVENWVRKFVTVDSIMVIRSRIQDLAEYSLAEVHFIAKPLGFLYADGYGVFEACGMRAPANPDLTRLLIPTPKLVEWALSFESWSSFGPVPFKRVYNDRTDPIRLKLLEQVKRLATFNSQ